MGVISHILPWLPYILNKALLYAYAYHQAYSSTCEHMPFQGRVCSGALNLGHGSKGLGPSYHVRVEVKGPPGSALGYRSVLGWVGDAFHYHSG